MRPPGAARLGFGCSGLMARLDRQQSLRLLEAAWDAGIRHFDTARLYGYGEAEGVLGEFLAGRREQATVVSKVGILPPGRSRGLALVKPLARQVAALYPPLRATLRRRAEGMVQSGAFDVATMRASLETSLRELRTGRLDLLLLHECGAAELGRGPVLDFLEESRARGLVGGFGIATDLGTVRAALAGAGPLAAVVQFPSSAFDGNIARLALPASSQAITHSALGPCWGALRADLGRDTARSRRWRDALGVDPHDADSLGRLLIAAALHANPDGTVLFSSTDPDRIARNARVAETAPPPGQVDTLLELARNWADARDGATARRAEHAL